MVADVVVVGVDGSADSVSALRWALKYAEERGDTVRVVHAWTDVPWYDELTDLRRDQLALDRARSEADAAQIVVDALRAAGVTGPAVRGVVTEGAPGAALVELSADADLLVVGAAGTGQDPGFGRVPLGATARYVTRYAVCPVTVVRGVRPRGRANRPRVEEFREVSVPRQRSRFTGTRT
ncbi:universal stress protein [Gandjariella thermophila]|uniref:universal stress protein n=1 Tax=Gandjariella thermophila TaxID=1931992 RepID=UPI0018655AA0|nr:universal stress protein [Gandjariella thermophila]